MPVSIHISPAVAQRFPSYRAFVLIVHGLQNGPSDEHTTALLAAAEQHVRDTFANQTLANHPHLAAWREAYRAFGVKPQRMLNSAEALMSRILKGGSLPPINRLADAYNAISVRYAIPCGGEDIDHVVGQVTLKFATGDEPFDTNKDGQPVIDHPQPQEVVWADDAGVTCRAWNWRQGLRTRLTETTTNAYFLFDALAPLSTAELQRAGDELQAMLEQLAPGCAIERLLLEAGAV